jgi:hypothetical protein
LYHRLKRIFATSSSRPVDDQVKAIRAKSRKTVSVVPEIRRRHERPQRAAAATVTDSLLKVERLVAKTFEVGRAAFDVFFSLNKSAPPGFSSRAL